jgi:RND family efflux transporter MFP subunit
MTKKRWILAGLGVAVVAVLAWLWMGRSTSEAESADKSAGGGQATAPVVRVEPHDFGDTLSISGAFKPFQDVDIHAKVAGYIKVIYVDVGDHVTAGETLAVLEVPELQAQLVGADAAVRRAKEDIGRAQGDLDRAKSSHAAAHLMYTRLNDASKTREGLVAQQEIDDAQAKDLETEAQISSAKSALSAAEQAFDVAQANQKQVSAMSDYTRITAPFAGVITNRYADTGALVAAGTSESTQAIPVVKLAQISVLRLVLPIPESVAGQIGVGKVLKVHVDALNRDYEGKVSRFADALNEQTRTMETEIDFQNPKGELMPGMYVEAYFVHNQKKHALAVPIEAVVREGDQAKVLVVDAQNAIQERPVQLGQEDSLYDEIIRGLAKDERVVVGNLGSFRSGQKVTPKETALAPANPSGGD